MSGSLLLQGSKVGHCILSKGMMRRLSLRTLTAAAIAAGSVMTTLGSGPPPVKLSSRTGTVVTPRNFPNHSAEDLSDMFRLNAELGSFAVVRVNWNDAKRFEAARVLVTMGDQRALSMVVELSPFKANGLKGASLDPGSSV